MQSHARTVGTGLVLGRTNPAPTVQRGWRYGLQQRGWRYGWRGWLPVRMTDFWVARVAAGSRCAFTDIMDGLTLWMGDFWGGAGLGVGGRRARLLIFFFVFFGTLAPRVECYKRL